MQKVYMYLFDNDNGYIYVIILIIAKSISDLSKTKITTGVNMSAKNAQTILSNKCFQ